MKRDIHDDGDLEDLEAQASAFEWLGEKYTLVLPNLSRTAKNDCDADSFAEGDLVRG